MATVSHPLAAPEGESLLDRIGRVSLLLGLLGPIGFLAVLRDIHPAFDLFQLMYLFFLFFLVPPALAVVEGIRGHLPRLIGRSPSSSIYDATDPRSWITLAYEPTFLKSLQIVPLLVHPTIVVRGLFQTAGAMVAYLRHGFRLPSPTTFESAVSYHLPFEGEWTVVNGSPDKRYSHSWFPVRQRYAYDFVITDDDGHTHDGTGGLESFYCYDEPILAPADGTVVRATDGHRDHHRTSGWFDPLQYRLAGNYVTIKHAAGEYSFLAHLRDGSVCVGPGDTVEQGEMIGRCGHSGNSSEPHLHVHLQDHGIPYIGAGLPIQFEAIVDHPDMDATELTQQFVHCGQTVRS